MTKAEMEQELKYKEQIINGQALEHERLAKKIAQLEIMLEKSEKFRKDEKAKHEKEKNDHKKQMTELRNELDTQLTIRVANEKELQRLRSKEDEMNKIIAGEYFKPKHNERNAGRKSIITYDLASKVRSMYDSGMSQKLISEQLHIAVGTVNKILKGNMSAGADQRDGDPDTEQCTL